MDGDIATLAVEESVDIVEDTESTVEAEPYLEAFENPEEVAEEAEPAPAPTGGSPAPPPTFNAFQQAIAYLLIGTAASGTAAGVGERAIRFRLTRKLQRHRKATTIFTASVTRLGLPSLRRVRITYLLMVLLSHRIQRLIPITGAPRLFRILSRLT